MDYLFEMSNAAKNVKRAVHLLSTGYSKYYYLPGNFEAINRLSMTELLSQILKLCSFNTVT